MSSRYLDGLAQALLESALAGLAPATTGRPAPSTAAISHGPPPLAWCCNDGMLTVHLVEVSHQLSVTELPQAHCAIVPMAKFEITIARCWPTMDDSGHLAAVDMDEAAGDLLEDLWSVLTELYDRLFDATVFPGQITCEQVVIGSATPLEAQGGCAGWTLEVEVYLNDSGPIGS